MKFCVREDSGEITELNIQDLKEFYLNLAAYNYGEDILRISEIDLENGIIWIERFYIEWGE